MSADDIKSEPGGSRHARRHLGRQPDGSRASAAVDEPQQPFAWALELPRSEDEIAAIQRARKRLALERAQRSRFLGKRVATMAAADLDDPEQWRKIPVLTKEELRKLPTEQF